MWIPARAAGIMSVMDWNNSFRLPPEMRSIIRDPRYDFRQGLTLSFLLFQFIYSMPDQVRHDVGCG